MNEVMPLKSIRDIERIKESLSNNPRNLLLFTIGINTALRISDILTLKVRDVSDTHIEITERKTSKRSRIKINDSIRSALRDLIPADANLDDWLFPSRKGDNHISRVQACRILNKAADVAGVNVAIGTHSLRKTFSYHAYKSCVELPLLMRVLNHASQRETLRSIGKIGRASCRERVKVEGVAGGWKARWSTV